MIDLTEFFNAVVAMRDAQNAYYKIRRRKDHTRTEEDAALLDAKQKEANVDRMIKAAGGKPLPAAALSRDSRQLSMFPEVAP